MSNYPGSKQPYPHNDDDDDENLVNWQQRGGNGLISGRFTVFNKPFESGGRRPHGHPPMTASAAKFPSLKT